MSDVKDELPKLDQLIVERQKELQQIRLSNAALPPANAATESTEEQLLTEVLSERLNVRAAAGEAKKKRDKEHDAEHQLDGWALLAPLGAALLALLFALGLFGNLDLALRFKILAGTAALLGVVAAWIRLQAHGGTKQLDGIGKSFGLGSALLAFWATAALLFLEDFS